MATRTLTPLKPLDSAELFQTVAGWLAQKENYAWLQFGDGRHILTPQLLKIMTQKDTHVLRVYTSEDGVPLGIVGLDEVNRHFKTARIWVVAGEKNFIVRGHATGAVSGLLTLAFRDLGLHAVNTWIVEHNPSVRIAERLGFKFIGRQRQCHWMDGVPYDRLWFDLLASEHKEYADD
jgi:RimJ/RimL family protein N-acetyltransferase